MDIKPTSYRYDGEGIECAYRNEKWVVCIKNWKPNNDIDGLELYTMYRKSVGFLLL